MNSRPLISILVPSYNQGEYIGTTIESVLGQEYENWELIIQDALSSDSTAEVCRKFSEADKRIKFYSEKDKGFADAVNKAISRASGSIAAIQSSDDFYSGSKVFTKVAELFTKYPGLYLLAGYHRYVNKGLQEVLCPQPVQENLNGFIDAEKLFNLRIHFPQSSTFFSLARAKEIGGLSTEVDMVADTDFWIRMANSKPRKTDSIFRVKDDWSCVIVHEAQRSVDQYQFSLGRTNMYFNYLHDESLDISQEKRYVAFRAHLMDALDYYFAGNKDTGSLKGLYRKAYGSDINWKWKIKELLNHSGIFRKWFYKHIPERSSVQLLSYPSGKSYNWFNK